jgi:cytochrome c oxidase subunit 2
LQYKLFTGFYPFRGRKKNKKIYMLNLLYLNLFNSCDAPSPWGLYFQDSATPQMEGLIELHDNIMFYLVIILFGVG